MGNPNQKNDVARNLTQSEANQLRQDMKAEKRDIIQAAIQAVFATDEFKELAKEKVIDLSAVRAEVEKGIDERTQVLVEKSIKEHMEKTKAARQLERDAASSAALTSVKNLVDAEKAEVAKELEALKNRSVTPVGKGIDWATQKLERGGAAWWAAQGTLWTLTALVFAEVLGYLTDSDKLRLLSKAYKAITGRGE